MAKRFREIFRDLTPSWLHTGDGELALYSLGVILDAAAERVRVGLESRFPSRAGTTALNIIGRDRGIPRGRAEANATYAERLKRWRYPRGHRVRGNAYALLEQVSAYFGGAACWTVDVSQNRHDRSAAGEESFSRGVAWNWDGEPNSPNWGRFWIVLSPGVAGYPPSLGDPNLWGGRLGTPGYTIGHTGIAPEDARAIRRLVEGDDAWKPAGTRPQWVVVELDGTPYTPDGTWGAWSRRVANTQSPTRPSHLRFWKLHENYAYAGDGSAFVQYTYLPDGSTYDGDGSAFPASITLPNGVVYAGNGASFPITVTLPDDGDLPA